MNFYISDIHFGCMNRYDNKTLEHDELIAENWNRVVTNGDRVYILGDIGKIGSNKDNEYLCKCLSVLKGHKTLVLGNHDKELKDIRLRNIFDEICDYKEITDNCNGLNHRLVLSHYPLLMWNNQHKGVIHLYGHIHKSDEWDVYKHSLKYLNDYFKDRTLKGYTDCPEAKAYNVGASLDYMDWCPKTLKEIIEANNNI